MKTDADIVHDLPDKTARDAIFESFCKAATKFHGYPAPGVLIGCYMVEAAKRRMPEKILYDAVCETTSCLPDAVQILTPCTVGNGWLRILNLGLYALSLYDKYTGEGVRVYLDARKLTKWEEVSDWYLQRKSKPEQNSERIRKLIREGAERMYTVESITVRSDFLIKRSKGPIRICPICREAYPERHGEVCRSCSGESPYLERKLVVLK